MLITKFKCNLQTNFKLQICNHYRRNSKNFKLSKRSMPVTELDCFKPQGLTYIYIYTKGKMFTNLSRRIITEYF